MATQKNDALSPATLIASAFKLDDQAALKSTSGIQSMAAGIFAWHAEKESTKPQFHAYAAKGQAYKDAKEEMIKAFIVPRISSKEAKGNPKLTAQVIADNHARNHAQMVAFNKGFDLAIALNYSNVGISSFDPTLGLFIVPVSALMPADASPLGTLKTLSNKGQRVPLDGKTYRIDSEDKIEDFKAYPARVLAIAGFSVAKKGSSAAPLPAPSTGASDTAVSVGIDATALRNDPTQAVGLSQMVKGMVTLAVKVEAIYAEEKVIPFNEIDTETLNAFTEMQIALDTWNVYLTKAKAMKPQAKAA